MKHPKQIIVLGLLGLALSLRAHADIYPGNLSSLTDSVSCVQGTTPWIDATAQDKNTTGTLAALNATLAIASNGAATVVVTLTGTWSATVNFEGFDGTNWISVNGLTQPAGGITAALVSNGTIKINSGGYAQIRARAAAYTSGTVNVFMNSGAGLGVVEVYNSSGDPMVVKGNGTAGAPDTSVVSVQGISGGTAMPANVTQFGGTNVSTGTGASGAGIPRVTIAQDSRVIPWDGTNLFPAGDADARAVTTRTSRTSLTANAPTTVSVGTTSTTIVAANASRKGLIIQNISVSQVSIGIGTTASLGNGITLYPGGTWYMDEFSFSAAQINGDAAVAASAVTVQEFQ